MSDIPLVIQLQQLASDPNCDIESLLNKAYVVARKLKIEDSEKYFQSELNGYSSIEDIPTYRKFSGYELIVTLQDGEEVPVTIADPEFHSTAQLIFCDTPLPLLGSILDKSNGNSNYMLSPIRPELMKHLKNAKLSLSSNMSDFIKHLPDSIIKQQLENEHKPPSLEKIQIKFDRMHIVNIVQAVRRLILQWSLELERQGITGEGFQFTLQEKQTAMSTQTFNITNLQGVAGNVSGGTVNQQNTMTVQTANFESLANNLRQHGIGDDDIRILQEAISQDPAPNQAGHFGEKVSAWLGSMMTKAATGTIGLAVGVAGTVLTDAIKGYYGI